MPNCFKFLECFWSKMAFLPRVRYPGRFLLLLALASGLSFMLMLKSQEKKNGEQLRTRDDDILTRRHVVSVSNVNKQQPDSPKTEDTTNAAIDPEIFEAMARLEKTLKDRKKVNLKNARPKPKPEVLKPRHVPKSDQDLPNPEEMLIKVVGPLEPIPEAELTEEEEILQKLDQQIILQAQICDKVLSLDSKKSKILILAHKNSGLKVLTEAFGNRHGVFAHIDPLDEALENNVDPKNIESLLYKLENLYNCVSSPDSFDTFKKSNRKTISSNNFLDRACQCEDPEKDSTCVTSVNLLSKMCKKFPLKVVTSSKMSMAIAHQLMLRDPALNVLYLFRDPRAVAQTRSQKNKQFDFSGQSGQLCKSLQSDLSVIDTLRRNVKMSNRFHFLRYEDIALQPEEELSKLVSNLQNRNTDTSVSVFCAKSVVNLEDKLVWNFDKNPIERINIWSKKLSMENINAIEEQCLNVLSKLEYHIIGKGD